MSNYWLDEIDSEEKWNSLQNNSASNLDFCVSYIGYISEKVFELANDKKFTMEEVRSALFYACETVMNHLKLKGHCIEFNIEKECPDDMEVCIGIRAKPDDKWHWIEFIVGED